MTAGPGKNEAYRYGLRAESLAALLLRLKGYRILARRYRSPVGEIDLIAKRGRVIAMVEVKARSGRHGVSAAQTLGAAQRRRIERAALAYGAAHPGTQNYDLRFDIVVLGPGLLPRHLPGAWIAGD